MESNKKVNISEGFGSWANRPHETRPFSMMPPSNLPLPPAGSCKVWQQPYWLKHTDGVGGASSSSGANQTHYNFQPSDIGIPNNMPLRINPVTTAKVEKDLSSYTDDDDHPAGGGAGGGDGQNKNTPKFVTVNGVQVKLGSKVEVANLDPRKLKRIISNRASAQKSRLKKIQYVAELERKAKTLETQIGFLAPQVEFFSQHKHYLQMEQKAMNEQIAAFANDKIKKEAEIEANKKEVARLRQLHMKLELRRMQGNPNASSRMMNWEGAGSSMQQMIMNPGFNHLAGQLGQMGFSNSKKAQAGEKSGDVKNKQKQPAGQASMAGSEAAPKQSGNSTSSNQERVKKDVNSVKGKDEDQEMEQAQEHTFI